MATGAFNPKDEVASSTIRPAHANTDVAERRWATDGMLLYGQDWNSLVAQFRTAMDAFNIVDSEGDDTILQQLASLGLRPGVNYVLDPGLQLWDEGTVLTGGTRAATLWKTRNVTNVTYRRQTIGIGHVMGARYGLRVQRTVGTTELQAGRIAYILPTELCFYLAGQQVMLAFNARVGADYSAGTQLICSLQTGTAEGEVFSIVTGWPTGNVTDTKNSSALITGGQRYVVGPWTIPANASEMAIRFNSGSWSGTAGANDWWEIANVDFYTGTTARPFSAVSYAEARSQIIAQYVASFPPSTAPVQALGLGTGEVLVTYPGGAAGVAKHYQVRFPTTMRAVPTVTIFNPVNANAQMYNAATGVDCSATTVSNVTRTGFDVSAIGDAGVAAGHPLKFHYVADARIG